MGLLGAGLADGDAEVVIVGDATDELCGDTDATPDVAAVAGEAELDGALV